MWNLCITKQLQIDAIGVKYTTNNNGTYLYTERTPSISLIILLLSVNGILIRPITVRTFGGTLFTAELIADNNEFIIYPNPADDYLYVKGAVDKVK